MSPLPNDTEAMLKKSLDFVSEAYLLHKVAVHRRPVYRHIHGDIALSREALSAFINGYFSEKKTPAARNKLLMAILDWDVMLEQRKEVYLADLGTPPALKVRGKRLLDAMFERYGRMVFEMGGEDAIYATVKGLQDEGDAIA